MVEREGSMSDLPKKGICDRCNGPLKKPSGYLVWNPITELTSKQPVGAMLICYTCAKKIFDPKQWKPSKAEFNQNMQIYMTLFNLKFSKGVNMSDPNEFSDFMIMQDNIYIDGIVQRLRNRGLDKKKAMKRARELGKLWWSDPKKAEKTVSKKKLFSSWK